MARRECILWLTTAALFLVTSTTAVPLADEYMQRDEPITQCSVSCPQTPNAKFAYIAGKTYEYSYESDIKTSVAGTPSEHSSLHMRATVLVDVISTCEMTLRLTDVTLQDSDPTRYESRQHVRDMLSFKKTLQDKSMSFSFVDGRIESVCPRSDDDTWAVNVRRGIVSTLQNTMTRLQGLTTVRETDVTGDCPVKYEVMTSTSQTLKIKKTKDLLACTDRHNAQTVFQGTPYSADSDVQSMPLMSSSHSCEQEINTRTQTVVKVTCTESHAFRPFAKWNSGATTTVAYKLTYRRVSDTTQRPDGARRIRATLLFDHTLTAQQTADAVRDTQQTFTLLCQKTQVDVRPDVPGLFTKLVHQMRRHDAATLRQLLNTVKTTCTKAEKFYRDALPLLGTTASVASMRQLIRDRQATEDEIEVWMTAVAFVKNPTKEMIKELKPLLESNMAKAALPVSSLVNTYCLQSDDRTPSADVVQIMKLFEDQLSYNCRSESDEQTGRMLTALRAIGNAGLAAQSVVATLTRCAANEAIPMSLRVAAVNAFRRIDCSTNNRNELFKLLENTKADSELRINAYLAVMQCASADTLRRVQTVLESDEINQVLSFIWTHLTNIRETASPLKQDIRAILENAELRKEFDMDKRKFSRNVELSTFSELLNVGATAESNLIWSGQSFVPRSASLNLTVDMFGRSINLLEVGGRVQGAEDILERLMGPGSDLDNAIKRDKRAPVRDEMLNRIDRTFDKQPDSDQLSYYLRVFGNDIRAGDIFMFDLEALKSKFNFLDWLIELAKDHNIDVTKNYHFLDTTIVIPTGTGMPLKLNAEGSATISMSARGKIDIRQIMSTPSNFDVSGSVKPSAAIEITASMGIDGVVAATGLKLVNTLHSSTVLDGVVQLRDGRVFNLDWNLPQDKIEVFSAESHVYITYRDADREQTSPEGQSSDWKRCTNRGLAQKAGLEMCAELTVPKPGSGSLGQAVAKIYINKLDTYRGLHFDASYIKSETEGSHTVRLSFNTPDSRIDRELTTEFILRRPQRQVLVNIKTPWKKINIDGSCVDNAELKKASLKMMLDDTTEYSISTELQIARNEAKQETKYTPKLQIVTPGRQNILLDGAVTITAKKYDVKLALKNAFSEPVSAVGWIMTTDKRTSVKYDVSMQIGAPLFKGNLTAYTSRTVDGAMKTWASRAVMVYTYRGGHREQFVVNHKLRDQSVSNLHTYSSDCSWTSTPWPRYNGQAGIELQYSANSVRTKIEAGLDDNRKVTIITSGAHDLVGREKKFNGLVQFKLPYKDWDYEVKVDHANDWESLQTNATVRSGSGPRQQTGTVDIGVRKDGDRPLSIVGEARLKYPGRELSITETLTERTPRSYSNLAVVQWQRGSQVRVESTYKLGSAVARHEMTNEITATGLDRPIRLNWHVLPNPKNAQGRIELVHDAKTYLVDGSWSVRGSSQQFNARAGAEVSYAGRGAAVSGEATRRDAEISGNAEVRVDGNARYAVSTTVLVALPTPKFQTRVTWPGENFVELVGTGKYDERSAGDYEGRVKLTSSLEPIRLIEAGFVHDQSANGFKTNGDLAWSTDRKITGELTADRSKAALTLATPFQGYRAIKAEGSFTGRERSGTVNGKLQWDGRTIAVMLMGDASQPDRSISGKMTFSSPFRGFEALAANFKHIIAGDKHTTNADFSWARGRQMATVITMTHQRNGWYMTNNGEMTVTTPFSGMRSSRLRWQHQNTADAWRCKHEVDVDGRKFAVDIDTTHRLSSAARRITGRASFQCPTGLADWLQNSSVSVTYNHDMRAIASVGKADLTYGRQRFGYEHDLTINPSSAFVAKAKLTTPYRSINEIGIALNNRLQGNGWTASNELLMGSHGRIGLDGTYQRTGYAIDATMALTTPYPSLERLSTTVRNQKQTDGAWAAHADVQYAADKQIAVDGKLGLESPQKVVEIEIRSPCPRLRQARAAAGYSGSASNFQASAELSHNALRDKIAATLAANTANADNMNVQLTVSSPFEQFATFTAGARHVRDTREHTATTATWALNRQRGSALVDMKVRNWADFDGRYELEYTAGRKLELATSFKLDPKIVATATFKSPFESARLVSASFNQEGPIDNFRASAEVTHNRVNRYTSALEMAVRDDSIRTSFRLATPHARVAKVAAAFSVTGRPAQFNVDSSFELNANKVSKTMSFQLGSGPTLALTGKLDTTFDAVRTLTYSVNHNGPATAFNNNLAFSVNGAETSASSEFRASGPNVKFDLRTPYRPLTQITVTHTTKPGRTFAGWANSASIEADRQRYSAESDMGWRGKELRAKVAVNVPEEYSIQLVHRANSTANFDYDVTVKLADQRIKKTVVLKTGPYNSIDFNAGVETSYAGYERWTAMFKNEPKPPAGFKTTASLTTPLSGLPQMSAELTYGATSQTDFSTTLKLNLPTRSARRVTATLNHRGTPQDLASDLRVDVDGRAATAAVTFKNQRRTTEGTFDIRTPFEQLSKFAGDFRHAGEPTNFVTTGKIEYSSTVLPDIGTPSFRVEHAAATLASIKTSGELTLNTGKYSAAFEHAGDAGDFRCNLRTTFPMDGETKTWEATVEHRPNAAVNPRSTFTIRDVRPRSTESQQYLLTMTKTGSLSNLQLSAEMRAPIKGLSQTTATYSHRVDWPNIVETNMVVQAAGGHRYSSGLTHTGGSLSSFRTTAFVETSRPGYERMSLTASNAVTRQGAKAAASVETSIPGYAKFAASSDLTFRGRSGWRWASTVETPLRGYDRWSANVEHASTDSGFRTSAQATTPIRNYQSFGATLTHAADTPSQFQTTFRISTPFREAPTVDVTLKHRGSTITDFDTGVKVEYGSGKKIEASTAFKAASGSYEGSAKLATTLCSYFQDFAVVASHVRRADPISGALAVTVNGDKKVDFDYSYSLNGEQSININVRSPQPITTELTVASSGQGSAVVNWDRSQIRFDFGLKNIVTAAVTDRYISFRTTVPRYGRTVGFGAGYTASAERVASRGELYWDRDAEPDFLYETELSMKMSPRREPTQYDGKLKVVSGLFNTDSTFTHRILQNGRRQRTEIVLAAAERLTIKSDMTVAANGKVTSVITVQHPRFSKDVTMTSEATDSSFKSTLEYETQSWTLEGAVNDETATNNGPKYSTTWRLANPASRLDIQLAGDYSTSTDDGTTAGGLTLKYLMSRDNQLKTLAALRTEINALRKEIKFNLETPIDTVSISTNNRELDLDNGIVRYDVNFECSHFFFRSVVDFSQPERSLDIKLYNSADKYVEAFAQALSPTQATFELSHAAGAERVTDVQLSTSYSEDEHIVSGRSYVRPRLQADVRAYLAQVSDSIAASRTRLRADADSFVSSMQADARIKSRPLQQSVVDPVNKIVSYVSNEVSAKRDQVAAAVNAVYNANEFYARDIYQGLKRHYDNISRRTAVLRRQIEEWSNDVSEQLADYFDSVNTWHSDNQRRLADYWAEVAEKWRQMQPDFENIKPYFDNLLRTTRTKLTEFYEKLNSGEWFREIVDKLSAINIDDYIPPPSQWQSTLEAYADQIDQWLSELLDKPEMHYVRNWLVASIQDNNWLYKLLGFEQQVNEWIAQLRSMTWETVKAKLRELADTYLELAKTKWTVWDPSRGEYAFQVFIPFELPDVSSLKRYDPRPVIVQTKNWIQRQLPEEGTTLVDLAYTYRPPSDLRDWIPPFKSHASLSGSQHYMTFDRRFFEFAGECSYLLARDFIGGTFSVIVNYDRPVRNQPTKKSLTIVTGGHQVEVYPDAKVTVDGTRVEMPVRVGNATVVRRGNLVSVVDDWRGVDITCDLPHDHCTLAVSGWYYGKTAGLFGTYDNEPSNDLTNADRTISAQPEVTAESWTVGTRCRPVNRAVVVAPEPDTRRYRACAELFGADSTRSMFRSCFRHVNTSAFMTMCLNDMPRGDNSLEAETDVCKAAAAYVHECRRREIHLRMPKQCVRCEVPTATPRVFYELDSVTLDKPDDIPRAADVVFVVQHAPCNRDVLEKAAGLADSIDKAMRSEGLTSIRYAVVGFGGKQSHLSGAHIHTMDGQIFNVASKLSLALNRFDMEAGDSADAMDALSFTARLPFVAGASKTVVLIGCNACRDGAVRYGDIQRILLNNDIHLHVLVQDTIRLKSKSPKTAYIYGVDQETVYTRKDVSGDELAGEPDLRRYIRLPKDLCVALTMDTDGSVFSVRQWLDSRPLIQKQFVDVMVRTVARKAQPTTCQICECLADEAHVGVSQCRSCHRPDPFYWLTPDFEADEEAESDTTAPSVILPNNNRPGDATYVTMPATTARRRPVIRTPPTRRPVGRVTRRPVVRVTRAPRTQ